MAENHLIKMRCVAKWEKDENVALRYYGPSSYDGNINISEPEQLSICCLPRNSMDTLLVMEMDLLSRLSPPVACIGTWRGGVT